MKSSLPVTSADRISPPDRKTRGESRAVLQLKPIHWSVGGWMGEWVRVNRKRVSVPRESARMFVAIVAIYYEDTKTRSREEDRVSGGVVPARGTLQGGCAGRQSLPWKPSLQRRLEISDNHR